MDGWKVLFKKFHYIVLWFRFNSSHGDPFHDDFDGHFRGMKPGSNLSWLSPRYPKSQLKKSCPKKVVRKKVVRKKSCPKKKLSGKKVVRKKS